MVANLTFRVLVWVALLAVLVPYCSAFQYNQTRDGNAHVSDEQDIYAAKADAKIKHGKSEEGEVGQDPLAATSQYQLTSWTTGPRRHRSTRWR